MAKANYPEINDLLAFTVDLGFTVKFPDKEMPSDGDPRTYYTFSFFFSQKPRVKTTEVIELV
jgi:hypothetical protein